MNEQWLVAHKVRGEPAFDVAERVVCAECGGLDLANEGEGEGEGSGLPCPECDSLGYWWIIPTSGHRAYPYWSEACAICIRDWVDVVQLSCPIDLPDHYRPKAEPKRTIDVSTLVKAKPFKMNRRI